MIRRWEFWWGLEDCPSGRFPALNFSPDESLLGRNSYLWYAAVLGMDGFISYPVNSIEINKSEFRQIKFIIFFFAWSQLISNTSWIAIRIDGLSALVRQMIEEKIRRTIRRIGHSVQAVVVLAAESGIRHRMWSSRVANDLVIGTLGFRRWSAILPHLVR